MNAKTRQEIAALAAELSEIFGAIDTSRLAEISGRIAELAEDEREKFENMSEGLQSSKRGQALEAAAEALETAQSELDELVGTLESAADGGEIVSSLETAAE